MPPMYEWIHNEEEQATPDKCTRITKTFNSIADFDKRPEKCEHCGYSEDTGWRKLIGSTKFILRGIGWYRDGYS